MNWHNTPIHILDFEGNGRSGVVEFGVATVFGGEVLQLVQNSVDLKDESQGAR